MSPEINAWVLTVLLAVLWLLPEIFDWTERQVSVRIRASWRALKRKDQS